VNPIYGNLLAQATDTSIWTDPNGSTMLFLKILLVLLFGGVLIFALMNAPTQARRPVVAISTFLAGLFYVLFYIWPVPIDRKPGDLPDGPVEGVGFWLKDAFGIVTSFTNILTAFLIGLGIYSLLSIHLKRLFRMQKDWFFSLVLLISMGSMILFGFWDWKMHLGPDGSMLENQANWTFVNYARDFLFEGFLQQMDAAMFSIIAFYILSAAYRAFRIRSIEATIMLATALLVVLSLMGAVSFMWDGFVKGMAGPDGNGFIANFQLTEVARWIKGTFQTSSIRGIQFGIGIGALAMGLRLWLSLEKTGGSS